MAGILTEKESILLMGQLILDVIDGVISKENSMHNIQEDINMYTSLGYMNKNFADRLKQMTEAEKEAAENIYDQIKVDLG